MNQKLISTEQSKNLKYSEPSPSPNHPPVGIPSRPSVSPHLSGSLFPPSTSQTSPGRRSPFSQVPYSLSPRDEWTPFGVYRSP